MASNKLFCVKCKKSFPLDFRKFHEHYKTCEGKKKADGRGRPKKTEKAEA